MSLLTKILAVQIHANDRGEYGMPLTDMVQAASAVLASHGYTWPRGLDGLLLVELDSCCTGDRSTPRPRSASCTAYPRSALR